MCQESLNAAACERSPDRLCIIIAVLLLLTIGCGGGSSDPVQPPPPPSNPQFTTTPPTAATEAVQYVYTMAATDSAAGTVSFALTSGPTGAAVSGNNLTWTPTEAQSRTANSFVVTATNTATSRTATQSWTVTPAGTVRGTRTVTYVTEDGDQVRPDDMTQATIAVHVPNGSGTYTTLAGAGANDGTCSVAAVPAGYYWLQHGLNYIWTNASAVDLGYAKLGRPDLVAAQSSTWINFQLDGLNPWQSGDAMEWYVANTNSELLNTTSQIGATTFNLMQPWSDYLIDSSKGDHAYASHLVTNTFSGKTIQVLSKALGPLSVTMIDGSTANVISGTMTDVATGNVMRANFKGATFSQYGASVNPQAVNDSTYVLLGALPGGNAKGMIGYPAYLIMYANTNGPLASDLDLGDIAYLNPFPSSWAAVLQYVQQFAVAYTAPGASNAITGYPAVYVATTSLPTMTEPLQPLVAPPVAPRINGHDLFQIQSAVGQTPTISWQAPSSATPTGYGVTLYRLYASASDSNVELIAYLWTDSTSVTLPPGLISSGDTYLFRVRSFYAPGMDLKTAPYRQTFPWAYADAFSATVTP